MLGLLLCSPSSVHAAERWPEALDRWLGAVVSPRALARAHAELEGISHCGDCHAGLRATPDSLCLDCHEAVADRMKAKLGWHGQLEGACVDCHVEHQGPDADLLGLDRDALNHELARFPLRGAHATTACDDCHERAGETGRVGFHAQDIAFERCANCHEDVHAADFARDRDCGTCHSERGFRADALVASSFDHARDTDYPLIGAHAATDCTGCHTPGARVAAPAAGRAPGRLAASDCAGCHEDPHPGSLGSSCESCHTPIGWEAEGKGARFDHARDTRFPLDPLHARLSCESCHEGLAFSAAGRDCVDCHSSAAALLRGRLDGVTAQPDPHASGVACRDCHAKDVAQPTLLDYERACLACHPASYASLLVSRKRIVDELVVGVESALRARALARQRGESAGSEAADAAFAAQVERVARSGLHHSELSEAALLVALDALGREAEK
jgi:hypothetical protein